MNTLYDYLVYAIGQPPTDDIQILYYVLICCIVLYCCKILYHLIFGGLIK